MNYPIVTTIKKQKLENKNVKTIMFEHKEKINPGQFYMLWIPGTDEIPMSVSYIDKQEKGITFRKVGEATNKLFNLKTGQKIGIKGPYGNGFNITGRNILFVGGGTGIAMLAPAIEMSVIKKIKASVVIGAKTKDELFFENRIKNTKVKLYITTDDGSKGYKGFTTDITMDLIQEKNFDQILTCGPEKMMKKLMDESKNIPFQASLERYMKCGFGLCGQCCIGEGLRVCQEGPIFDKKILKNINDFGKYKKDSCGRKIKI